MDDGIEEVHDTLVSGRWRGAAFAPHRCQRCQRNWRRHWHRRPASRGRRRRHSDYAW